MIFAGDIELSTRGFSDILDITEKVRALVAESGIADGLVCVFCRGSTGSVTTIEFEDGVINDLKAAIERLVPSGQPYEHDKRWGDGNGFSHVRAALMKPSVTIPLVKNELVLGTWQQVVFLDFDNRSRTRHIVVQIMGE